MTGTAVLLMAFGGPESVDQVPAFMSKLTGRALPPAAVERIAERYRAIGGGSPLPAISRAQAAALQRRLEPWGRPPVKAAFKYAEPSIAEAVDALARAGYRRVVGVSLAAHHTRVGAGAYLTELEAAGTKTGVTTVAADLYFGEPHFLDGLATNVRRALDRLSHPEGAPLVFTAHSLPLEHIEQGDPYVDQLLATVGGVVERVPGHPWRLAYQSRGTAPGPWLGPDVEAVLAEVAAAGAREVVVVPVAFTADHLETLYDLDVVVAGRARELGVASARAETLNADPLLVEALAAVTIPHLRNWPPVEEVVT